MATATSASAFLAVAFAAAVTSAAATATTATAASGESIEGLLEFCVGGFASSDDLTFVVEGFAGVEFVEIEHYGILLYIVDEAIEAHAFFVDEGDDVAGVDGIVGKFTVNAEHLLADLNDALWVIRTIGFIYREREVEGVALVEISHVGFKGFEGHAEVRDKLEGVLLGSLFDEFVDAGFIVGIKVV